MPKHDVDFDVRDGSQVAAEQLVDEGAVHLVSPGWLTVIADTILGNCQRSSIHLARKTTKGVPKHEGVVHLMVLDPLARKTTKGVPKHDVDFDVCGMLHRSATSRRGCRTSRLSIRR